jgi:DUF4097 and DUF4098 domain-containing protein YvlB
MAQTENYHTIRYGNKDGELKFGHVHNDNVISAFLVRSGKDHRHYITMDSTGDQKRGRKGGTINRCPGTFQIKAGDDVDVNSDNPAIYIEAVQGDIILKATDGNIRLQGRNVEILANGHDNKNGVITLESNEKIELTSKNIECNASSVAKFFSSGTCKIVGDNMLDIYGGLAACATGASKMNPSKYPSIPQDENNSIL